MLQFISKRRFDALAGYIRMPELLYVMQEFEWLATPDERVLGVLTWDRSDADFAWSALAPDEIKRYRWVEGHASYPSAEAARDACVAALERLSTAPDEEFHQGDTKGKPVDFFIPVVPEERLHPHFRILARDRKYSPARELISAMMRYHEDLDGNFVEQFQTTGFDARLWELYIYATATELNYARARENYSVPDFCLADPEGRLAIECTTANPPDKGVHTVPSEPEAFNGYRENYIPIKLARALKAKLNKKYWEQPHMKDVPLVFAVQDFHSPGIMRAVTFAATEYVYGYRHSFENGRMQVVPINEHRYNGAVEPSGFFNFPGAEHVSAVVVNPQGTLTKFNRMGYLAGFGDREIRMMRFGVRRGERDGDGVPAKSFSNEVWAGDYEETWIEGMTVLHNPNAKIPLDPMMLAGAAHEFVKPDGRLRSLIPDFHPVYSNTLFITQGRSDQNADDELAHNPPGEAQEQR
jgi:hypothetical protein